MKKGSKAIKCEKCNRIVAWSIPTGKTEHGINVVSINELPCCKSVCRGFALHYMCDKCYFKERIKELEKSIERLRRFRELGDFSKYKESEIIISICEYKEEIEELKKLI